MASTRLAKLVIFLLGLLILLVILILVIASEPIYDNETEELLDGRDWSEVRGKTSELNLTSTVIEQYVEEKTIRVFEGTKSTWSKIYTFS